MMTESVVDIERTVDAISHLLSATRPSHRELEFQDRIERLLKNTLLTYFREFHCEGGIADFAILT
ncbi:MAG: hypothetical protein AAF236_09920, partial [Verrucomicrobiota bacterium]